MIGRLAATVVLIVMVVFGRGTVGRGAKPPGPSSLIHAIIGQMLEPVEDLISAELAALD